MPGLINFHLTKSINNNIFNFGVLYGRMSSLDPNTRLMRSVIEENLKRANISAVSLDKNILEKITLEKVAFNEGSEDLNLALRDHFIAYSKAKLDILPKLNEISPESIKTLHQAAQNAKKSAFRTNRKLLPKVVLQNSIMKQIELEVKTAPNQIKAKLESLLHWLSHEGRDENPVILASIGHFKIAEIHPFDDGNGRLGRLLEYLIMKLKGFDITNFVATETVYLQNSERYFDLIESTIESGDMTEWIEFYAEALLSSILKTAKQIYMKSGGCIDVVNNKIVEINEIEQEILDLMRQLNQPSPAEIAKTMKTSRQNVHYFIKSLYKKGILNKVGSNTASKYVLKV